ncbi:MAG TPA: hypothetical protein VE650_04270 [Acetobacteraceae bacterium]|jgi:hypothetical protein|nr:hypothetical protein [Acetobacteraceae bacterium]
MMRLLLPLLMLPLIAASPPQRGLSLSVPGDNSLLLPFSTNTAVASRTGPSYEPAPTPNRDVSGPTAPRATNEPTLTPSLFTTRNQYRGDGFSPGSTAQSEQEKRMKPGAGFSLHMPLTGQ